MRAGLRTLLIGIIFSIGLLGNSAGKKFWENRVPLIETKLGEAMKFFEKGDIKSAKKACDDAYFGIFEDITANMEVAIRSQSRELASDLESQFGDIRKRISKNEPKKNVEAGIKKLANELKNAAKQLDSEGVSPE